MLVKIRLASGRRVQPNKRKNQHLALALASLLTPAAVMGYVLASWRVTADLKATGQFPITSGLFSHWQVWLMGAAALHFGSVLLNRYGKLQPAVETPTIEPERKLANSRV